MNQESRIKNQELDQSENPKYFLGVDWGMSLVGLSIADNVMRIASALEEVEAKTALDRIFQLDKEYDFEKIVLGKPSHEKFPLKKNFEVFLAKLQESGKQIVLENENFSTKMAQRNLAEKNKKGSLDGDNVESARLILQAFLDKDSKK